MKKFLLLAVASVMGLALNAQIGSKPTVTPQSKPLTVNKQQVRANFSKEIIQKDAPLLHLGKVGKKLTPHFKSLMPVQRNVSAKAATQAPVKALQPVSQRLAKNLKTMNPSAVSAVKATRKAAALRDSYTGKGFDRETMDNTEWQMFPVVMQMEDNSEVPGLIDMIPMPEDFADIYPDGVPVSYSINENIITVQPQPVLTWQNEAQDTTFYMTFCSVNSDNEDGSISLQIGEDGMLKVIDGNMIAYVVFANTPFDEEFGDSYFGWWELVSGVRYVYDGQKEGITVEKEYRAFGIDVQTDEPVSWTLQQGTYTEDGEDTPIFVNMSPMDEMFSSLYPDGIDVTYEQNGNTITVKPQVIAQGTDKDDTPFYVILFSGLSDDGSIVLTVGNDGSLNTANGEAILIGSWQTRNFDPTYETYDGYYTYTDRVKYYLPDAPLPAPSDVSCAVDELVLFAGLGRSGYSYQYNLAMAGAFAPLNFLNGTKEFATSYSWSVKEKVDDEENTLTANTKDFTLDVKGDATYSELSLIGYNDDQASEPYNYGCSDLDDENNLIHEQFYLYGGGSESNFNFKDGTYALMSRYNPNKDMAFYTNFSTPDFTTALSNPYSISKLYSYQGKPSTPLYITGITLPVLNMKDVTDNFNLHVTIYKCERSSNGRLTLGDVIAQGDATAENITVYDIEGVTLSNIDFNELYVEDDLGMSETLDYLFIEDEFVVAFEGIDNGTFSGRFGSQTNDNENLNVLWFEVSGEEGSLYSFTGWKPALLLGLDDATYGYLKTDDNTQVEIGRNGGEASIHITPMYYSVDEDTEEPTYLLYVESILVDGEEAEDVPDWLSVSVANEDYTTAIATDEDGEEYQYFVNGIDYDLVLEAEAMPAEVNERTAELSFMQPGARLVVKVTQSDNQGISTVVTKVPVKNSRAYNLAGQSVKTMKGIVVKDGRKQIVK